MRCQKVFYFYSHYCYTEIYLLQWINSWIVQSCLEITVVLLYCTASLRPTLDFHDRIPLNPELCLESSVSEKITCWWQRSQASGGRQLKWRTFENWHFKLEIMRKDRWVWKLGLGCNNWNGSNLCYERCLRMTGWWGLVKNFYSLLEYLEGQQCETLTHL